MKEFFVLLISCTADYPTHCDFKNQDGQWDWLASRYLQHHLQVHASIEGRGFGLSVAPSKVGWPGELESLEVVSQLISLLNRRIDKE